MAAKFICDGCGKEEQAIFYSANPNGWHKPEDWFQRSDKESGPQDCCSRECIQIVAKRTGKTALVSPV